MRVMVVLEDSPKQILLVKIGKEVVNDVAKLLARSRRDEAIVTALTKGEIQGQVGEEEASHIKADLLLTREGTHWNLV